MNPPLIITAAARADVDDAHTWYEHQQLGRGDQFVAEFVSRVNDIVGNPHTFPLVSRSLRGAPMARSNFIVYYRIDPIAIVVTAVQHANAHPKKWKRRK